MKWIKASERLPEYPNDPKNHVRLNGQKVYGNFYNSENGEPAFGVICYANRDSDYVVSENNFHRIEWLDESNEENGWDWVAIFYGALYELVQLKDLKDSEGKTENYLERQPKAWYLAKSALELWKKSDYGALPLESELSRLKEENERLREEMTIIHGLFERFIPKEVALDDLKQMAMYEAFHRIKNILPSPPNESPDK